jgi:hypothetical protein
VPLSIAPVKRVALTDYDALMTRAATVAEQRRAAGLNEVPARTKSDPFEQLYSVWLEINHQMRVIAAANKVPLLHIVQPNQFFWGAEIQR